MYIHIRNTLSSNGGEGIAHKVPRCGCLNQTNQACGRSSLVHGVRDNAGSELKVLRLPGKQVPAVECSGVVVNVFGSTVCVLVQVLAITHCSCPAQRTAWCKKYLLVEKGQYTLSLLPVVSWACTLLPH